MKRITGFSITALLLILFFSACGTVPSGTSAGSAGKKGSAAGAAESISASPMYYGSGEGSTQSGAINAAKVSAVKKAVSDALGTAAAMANREKLEDEVYGKININALVYNDTLSVLDRSSDNGQYTVSLGVKINLPALADALRGADIYGGIITPQGGDVALPDQEPPVTAASAEASPAAATGNAAADSGSKKAPSAGPAAGAAVDPEEAALIREIVDNLTYMVYFDESAGMDPFIAKAAVGMANKFLSENGMEYVDLEQIERIKKDQAAAYEEETGESISMIQWIAGKLNADIYIEVSVDTNSSTKGGKYYGSASVSLKNYDSSTGSGRGTAFYQTVPPALSMVSEADAVNNAVASATYNAIKKAVQQAQGYTEKELVNGLKYDLVIQNTPDSRLMRDFMKKLQRKVKSVKRISTSSEETKYEVRIIGRIEDLEDIVYDTADSIPGMEGLALVYQRGSSITFDSGM
ncbi:MAG: hypothetical protein DRP59_00375 [Spirochaetes bacterium]|nr:MAG: hypothetical protein DRP59_00375 [Spirochaetota bacterium]